MISDDALRKRRKLWTLLLCCIGQFMVILDVSIVNVALPSIRHDLGFSGAQLQWVVNAYTLTFAGFLLLGGRAADLLGRRRVFAAGLVLFAAASLIGGVATSRAMLVGARALQGIGGAIVAPASLSVLSTTFREGAERNRALGAWGAMGGAGGATGVVLGGVLTQTLGWRWILFINVPIGLVAALAAGRLIAESRQDVSARRNFDVAGALTVTAGLVAVVYAIVGTDTHGWGSAQTLIGLAVGLVLLALFLVIEGRVAKAPLVPLRIFKSRTLTGANVVVLALGGSTFAMWYFLSLYMQEVLGFTPIQAGLAFLPMTLMIVTGSTLAGRLTVRLGAGPLLAAGLALIAIGLALLTRVAVSGGYAADVLGPSVLAAAGIGLAFVPATIGAVAGVSATESGLASGLVNTSRQVGGSLGLAILATIASQRTSGLLQHESSRAALTAGFHSAFLVGACFAAAGAAAAVVLVPRVRGRARGDDQQTRPAEALGHPAEAPGHPAEAPGRAG